MALLVLIISLPTATLPPVCNPPTPFPLAHQCGWSSSHTLHKSTSTPSTTTDFFYPPTASHTSHLKVNSYTERKRVWIKRSWWNGQTNFQWRMVDRTTTHTHTHTFMLSAAPWLTLPPAWEQHGETISFLTAWAQSENHNLCLRLWRRFIAQLVMGKDIVEILEKGSVVFLKQ